MMFRCHNVKSEEWRHLVILDGMKVECIDEKPQAAKQCWDKCRKRQLFVLGEAQDVPSRSRHTCPYYQL